MIPEVKNFDTYSTTTATLHRYEKVLEKLINALMQLPNPFIALDLVERFKINEFSNFDDLVFPEKTHELLQELCYLYQQGISLKEFIKNLENSLREKIENQQLYWNEYKILLKIPEVKALDEKTLSKLLDTIHKGNSIVNWESSLKVTKETLESVGYKYNFYTLLANVTKKKPKQEKSGIAAYLENPQPRSYKTLFVLDNEKQKMPFGIITKSIRKKDGWILQLNTGIKVLITSPEQTVEFQIKKPGQSFWSLELQNKNMFELSISDNRESVISPWEYIISKNPKQKRSWYMCSEDGMAYRLELDKKSSEVSIFFSKYRGEFEYLQTLSCDDFDSKYSFMEIIREPVKDVDKDNINEYLFIEETNSESLAGFHFAEAQKKYLHLRSSISKNGDLLVLYLKNLFSNNLKKIDTSLHSIPLELQQMHLWIQKKAKVICDQFNKVDPSRVRNENDILIQVVLETNYFTLIDKMGIGENFELLELLGSAFSHLERLKSKHLVLFMGDTGAGKSTALAHFLGADMEISDRVIGGKNYKVKENDKAYPKVGQSLTSSETLYPQGFSISEFSELQSDVCFVDCPGSRDTRGGKYQLCINLSMDYMIQHAKSIQSVVFVIPASAFSSNRGDNVIQMFKNLQERFPKILQRKPPLSLLITRDSEVNDSVREALITGKTFEEYKNSAIHDETQSVGISVQEETKYRRQIWDLLSEMHENGRVEILDIQDEEQKNVFLEKHCSISAGHVNQYPSITQKDKEAQENISNCVEMSAHTWTEMIFKPYFDKLPKEIASLAYSREKIIKESNRLRNVVLEKKQMLERFKRSQLKISKLIEKLATVLRDNSQLTNELRSKLRQASNQILEEKKKELGELVLEIQKKNGEYKDCHRQRSGRKALVKTLKTKIENLTAEVEKLSTGDTKTSLWSYQPEPLQMITTEDYGRFSLIEQPLQVAAGDHTGATYRVVLLDKKFKPARTVHNNISLFESSVALTTAFATGLQFGLAAINTMAQFGFLASPLGFVASTVVCAGAQYVGGAGGFFSFAGGLVIKDIGNDLLFTLYEFDMEGHGYEIDVISGVPNFWGFGKHAYQVTLDWKKGEPLPWFNIFYHRPNREINAVEISNKRAEIEIAKKELEKIEAEWKIDRERRNKLKGEQKNLNGKKGPLEQEIKQLEEAETLQGVNELLEQKKSELKGVEKEIIDLSQECVSIESDIEDNGSGLKVVKQKQKILIQKKKSYALLIHSQSKTMEFLKEIHPHIREIIKDHPEKAEKACDAFIKDYERYREKLSIEVNKDLGFTPLEEEKQNEEDWEAVQQFTASFNREVYPEDFHGSCEQAFVLAKNACEQGLWSKLAELREVIAKLTPSWHKPLLDYAIENKKDAWVEELIKHQINIHYKDSKGNNAFHTAARQGRSDLIELLSSHIGVNEENLKKQTPLHAAIGAGHHQFVEKLLEKGANIHALVPIGEDDQIKLNAFGFAVMMGQISCIDVLAKQKDCFKLNSFPKIGGLLHTAVYFHQLGVLQHLLKQYKILNIEEPNQEKMTPLCFAASLDEQEAIAILKSHDAFLESEDNLGRRPMHHAAIHCHLDTVQLLAALGAKINSLDSKGNRPRDLVDKSEDLAESCYTLLNRLALEKIINMPIRRFLPPVNLVFQGGGPKGLGHVGGLLALHEKDYLGSVRRVTGTSAGAIIASLLAVNYPVQNLEGLLKTTDMFELLLDHPLTKTNLEKAYKVATKDFISMVKTGEKILGTLTSIYYDPSKLLTGALEYLYYLPQGVCEGESFREWLEDLIFKQTGISHMTFGELAEKIKEGKPYKHLHVYATKIGNPPEIVHISSEDPKWKDVIISDAIRSSMSIPVLFKPHRIYIKFNGERVPMPEYGLFLDGGLQYNFPIETFDQKQFLTKKNLGKEGECPKFNKQTLGFSLFSSSPVQQDCKMDTLYNLFEQMVRYQDIENAIRNLNPYNNSRIVKIDVKDVTTYSFNMSDSTKDELLASGKKGTTTFIDEYPNM